MYAPRLVFPMQTALFRRSYSVYSHSLSWFSTSSKQLTLIILIFPGGRISVLGLMESNSPSLYLCALACNQSFCDSNWWVHPRPPNWLACYVTLCPQSLCFGLEICLYSSRKVGLIWTMFYPKLHWHSENHETNNLLACKNKKNVFFFM